MSEEKVSLVVYDKAEDEKNYVTADGGDGRPSRNQDGGKKDGLGVIKTAIFILGETAGSGIMAFPFAMESTGYTGVLLIVVAGLVAMYNSIILGRCWLMVQSCHPEYKGHVRNPYAVIGRLTYGTPGRVLVSLSGGFHLFFSSVVFVVMASQNIESLLENVFHARLSFCYVQLILVAILLPVTWLGSPKDMWFVGAFAGVATLGAVALLMLVITEDGVRLETSTLHGKPDLMGTVQAMGVINFAYGGHSAYPVIQCDMKDPTRWNVASKIAFSAMLVLSLCVGLGGFLVYGSSVKDNVLLSATPGPVLYVIILAITCHLLCAFVTIINPVVQEVEEIIGMRKAFSWRRILSRSTVVLVSLLVAESLPQFGALVALVGAVGSTALAFLAPPLFYLRLNASPDYNQTGRPVPLYLRTILVEIVVVSILVGLVAAYSALSSLFSPGSFALPCYLDSRQQV